MEAGYRGLFLLYWQEEKWDSIAKYSNLQYQQTLPALADKNAERVQQMQGLYNYSRIQNDAKKTAEKNEQQKSMIIILLVAVIALALVAICVGKLLGFALKRPTTHYINPHIDARHITMTGDDATYNENQLNTSYGQKDSDDGQ